MSLGYCILMQILHQSTGPHLQDKVFNLLKFCSFRRMIQYGKLHIHCRMQMLR